MTTPSQDVRAAWQAHVIISLAEHIAQAVGDHLPEGDEVIATGTHLVLTRRTGGGPARTVVTQQMSPAHETLDRTAAQVLDDLQDMVIGSMHRPWPQGDSGVGLHPWAGRDGARINLAFTSRDGSNGITLPPFPIPPEPERVVSAG